MEDIGYSPSVYIGQANVRNAFGRHCILIQIFEWSFQYYWLYYCTVYTLTFLRKRRRVLQQCSDVTVQCCDSVTHSCIV